ncbi:hypothetical protein [Aliikangiella sp. IMCC44359]|uniref:hypothetical protein n=1 Tax=Aliikangiella sp. IMCC44359 TaxID=3459125 RepID=UPI00403A94AE
MLFHRCFSYLLIAFIALQSLSESVEVELLDKTEQAYSYNESLDTYSISVEKQSIKINSDLTEDPEALFECQQDCYCHLFITNGLTISFAKLFHQTSPIYSYFLSSSPISSLYRPPTL